MRTPGKSVESAGVHFFFLLPTTQRLGNGVSPVPPLVILTGIVYT